MFRLRVIRALVSVALGVLLVGCPAAEQIGQEIATNGPLAQTPQLLGVFNPAPPPGGPTPVTPNALGSYQLLPSRSVIVDVGMPWPADIEVSLDGLVLERASAPSDRATELENAEVGYFDYDITDANANPARWRVYVSPPPARRKSGSLAIDIRMVSLRQGATGADLKSEPVSVRVRDSAEPLLATFNGRAVMEINNPDPAIKSLKRTELSFAASFRNGGSEFRLESFPELVFGPYSIGAGGENTTTVKKISGGTGTMQPDGTMSLPIGLSFEHSHPLAGNSTASFSLTTGTAGFEGWRIDEGARANWTTREVRLIGATTFQGGYLGGNQVRLSVPGTFTALP